ALDKLSDRTLKRPSSQDRIEEVVAARGHGHEDVRVLGVLPEACEIVRRDVVDRRAVLGEVPEAHAGETALEILAAELRPAGVAVPVEHSGGPEGVLAARRRVPAPGVARGG